MKIEHFLFFLIFPLLGLAQETEDTLRLNLQEAVELGLERNYASIKSEKEVEKALSQKWEIISQGLPQIGANVDYQNFLKQPVTLLPGEIAGQEPGSFVPVRFGTQQNLSATATWSQLLFDGSYIVGVQSARTLLQISKNAKVKTDLEVKKAVIEAYGNVLLAEESVEILSRNLKNVSKNLEDTEQIYENGLAEQEDVEQLKMTRLSIENNLSRSKRMVEIAYQLLNMTLGIPVEKPVVLTGDLETLAMMSLNPELLERSIPIEENIDVRIAQNSSEAAGIYVRLEKAKALPSLTGFLNYGAVGHGDEFTFLDEDQVYYSQSILGVSLNIPIFSSGMRHSRTRQKQLEYEQALLDLEQTKNEVKLQIASAKSDYSYSLENLRAQRENLSLAERIEQKNQIKFYEGLASSFELSEAQRQLYTAQQALLQAMLEVINTRVALETVLSTTTYQSPN